MESIQKTKKTPEGLVSKYKEYRTSALGGSEIFKIDENDIKREFDALEWLSAIKAYFESEDTEDKYLGIRLLCTKKFKRLSRQESK